MNSYHVTFTLTNPYTNKEQITTFTALTTKFFANRMGTVMGIIVKSELKNYTYILLYKPFFWEILFEIMAFATVFLLLFLNSFSSLEDLYNRKYL